MSTGDASIDGSPLDDLAPILRERLSARVDRLGYLGEFFVRAASQPVALAHFIDWTEALKTELPFRVTEAIALTISARTGNDYERVQHERLALANGMSREEIEAIESGRMGRVESLSETEVAAAALCRCLLDDNGRGCEPALRRLARCADEATAVAALMMAGRYLAHATMANAWGLKPPLPSPLEPESG